MLSVIMPFRWQADTYGTDFLSRIQHRLGTERQFSLLQCQYDWHDTDGMHAAETSSLWGSTSKQYLAVSRRTRYVLLGVSDEPCWWYVAPIEGLSDVFAQGGWAPPTAFLSDGAVSLFEVSLPVLRRGETEHRLPVSIPRLPSSGAIHVYSDGSSDTSTGRAFAGGWVFSGTHISGFASLYVRISGSEASELLGIVGALHAALVSPLASEYVFLVDSERALDHVFRQREPLSKDNSVRVSIKVQFTNVVISKHRSS